jgi:hypothetical protein
MQYQWIGIEIRSSEKFESHKLHAPRIFYGFYNLAVTIKIENTLASKKKRKMAAANGSAGSMPGRPISGRGCAGDDFKRADRRGQPVSG